MNYPSKAYGSLLAHCPAPLSPALRELEARLDALTLLSGRLAHDFNNFLAPLLGYTALIKEELASDSKAMSYAIAIEQSARRTNGLLEEILISSRTRERVFRKSGDFTGMLRSTVDLWKTSLPKDSGLSVSLDCEEAAFFFDPKLWKISFEHLLENARMASPNGGIIEISLKKETLSPARAAELGILGKQHLHFRISDRGTGMSASALGAALNPFFSTRPKTYGRGLGLTIVHTVTRSHGGQILVSSEEGKGTTVDIWVPVDVEQLPDQSAPPPAETQAAPARSPSRSKKKNGKILVVDDDANVSEIVEECLRHSDYETLIASDGSEGLKTFRKNAKDIVLVISDISMPNMNGVEMTLEIRKLHPDLPILFMSGAPEVLKQEVALFQLASPSSDKVLKKPFALRELLDMVVKLTR